MAISMLKIRRPLGRLIFNMGIAIPGKTVFLIETAPWSWKKYVMEWTVLILADLIIDAKIFYVFDASDNDDDLFVAQIWLLLNHFSR